MGYLRVLFTPRCWIQSGKYSAEWDKALNNLMTTDNFDWYCERRASIGGVHIWVDNHPYASFTIQLKGVEVRPSRRTVLKAYDKLIKDTLVMIFSR